MSARDLLGAAAFLARIAVAADGTFLGLALAFLAGRSIKNYTASSSAFRKIHHAPSLRVSDIPSVLSPSDDSDSSNDSANGKLVIVRGSVEAKPAVNGNWISSRSNVLVSRESGEKGVILQTTQTCIYHELRGFIGWASDLRAVFLRPWNWKEEQSSALRMVPFVLVEGGRWSQSEYLIVNMEGSSHQLPLVTVYHQLQPIGASACTFVQALFGHEYPVGLLEEEKILPLGKDITAVGNCCLKDGVAEIKSCKDLPYFLSDMTKDEMVEDLAYRTNLLFWSGTVLGVLSIGILGFAAVRWWNKWKEWQRLQGRRRNLPDDADPEIAGEEEEEGTGDVPDGELCVICLTRRKSSAFIPCGHLVCCQRCALVVQRDSVPKCPVCRQTVRSSVRIYDA